MALFLAVANRKGGVGKSTVSVMLAHAYSVWGEKRVLVLDVDSQCNASLILLGGDGWHEARSAKRTIADYIKDQCNGSHRAPPEFVIGAAGDVVGVVAGWLDARFADERAGRAVQDRLRPEALQQRCHAGPVRVRPNLEVRAGGDRRPVAGREIVEHRNVVAGIDECRDGHRTDVPGATRNEDPHRRLPSSRSTTPRRFRGFVAGGGPGFVC